MKYFLAGGAGFIGSTLAHKLLEREPDCKIVIYDNFSVGKHEYIEDISHNKNVEIWDADIKDLNFLTVCMKGCDIVYHFASNADIAKAMNDPAIDFWDGTYLTQNILEAMRKNGINKIIYASGSGVYGDYGYNKIKEEDPFLPVTSGYGASKQAGEALIAAYCHMFDMQAIIYRFANVVGKNQTHGIVSDFVKKVNMKHGFLQILGDGTQLKCYIHVEDIIKAILMSEKWDRQIEYYNVSSGTYISVDGIADIVLEEMGEKGKTFKSHTVKVGGGWKGDIPVVFLNSRKIRETGWRPMYSSRDAIRKTVREILGKE